MVAPKTPMMLGLSPIKNCQNQHGLELDGNWSSFQLAKSTPPQSVIVMLMPLPQGCPRLDVNPTHSTFPDNSGGHFEVRRRPSAEILTNISVLADNSGGHFDLSRPA